MESEKHLVSIIVPVYNVEQYLRTCIDSILSQTYTNWELLLINDGSPDNSPAICDEYAVSDSRIKVFHKENGGVASARNMGLDNAKGEYIAFLDSDDFWHKLYLENLLGLCLEHDADIAQCEFTRGTDKVFPKLKNKHKIKVYDNYSVFLSGRANVILPAKLYKRYLFEKIRMPESKSFEDDFTTWKCYYNAKIIAVSIKVLYYYYMNDQSTMAGHAKQPNLDYFEAYEERINFFINNEEKDLEVCSRSHFCKALLLTSQNKTLTPEQRKLVDGAFLENWQKIKNSKFVSMPLRILFLMFRYAPKTTLRLVSLVR